jgi:hypothetical protein
MKQVHVSSACLILLLCSVLVQAQQTVATNTNVAVPPLVNYGGVLTDLNGKPLSGVVGVTFLLYQDQQGGAPLWMETQNVQPDSRGHYTVMLGSTSSTGLPSDIFVAGEAHWLGVQVQGQEEQPRVLLVSAPYALKAGDAQTLGGLPASAFVLAVPPNNGKSTSRNLPTAAAAPASVSPLMTSDVTTSGGTVNVLPLFTTATNIQNSLLTQTGTTAINVGGQLNVKNTTTVTGTNSSGVLQVTNTGSSGANPAIVGTTNSSNASGVVGLASASSGTPNGVYGSSVGGNGVYGSSASGGYGVRGSSPNVGVYGRAHGGSVTGEGHGFAGVWGDTGGPANSGVYVGVVGTADENVAGYFANSSSSQITLSAQNNAKSSSSAIVLETTGPNFGGFCTIDVSGDLTCTGSKSAVVKVDQGSRRVKLYAVEAPENWFEDAGSGQLSNGTARIELDATFAQTVNTGEYHVFLTPNDNCKGLYATHKSANSFEVHELDGGKSNIAFDYRIMAKRKGYESIRLADVTDQYQDLEQQEKLRRERVEQGRTARSATVPIAAVASPVNK